MSFVLLGTEGCHLCEEMEQEITVLETKLNFKTEVITINNDSHLETLYGEKVPVLTCANEIVCMYVLDEHALTLAIKQNS